jgi:hypothetical protein
MKAYIDKDSGKWKWGTRGKPIYDSKIEAERGGLDILTERLRYVRDHLEQIIGGHGRI